MKNLAYILFHSARGFGKALHQGNVKEGDTAFHIFDIRREYCRIGPPILTHYEPIFPHSLINVAYEVAQK